MSDNDKVISDEAVEAAAKGTYSVGKIDAGVDWEDLYPALREVYIGMARQAVAAAAPYILAPVVALADQWQEDFPYKANQLREAVAPNPYRSQA
jgi:hypothetical protein